MTEQANNEKAAKRERTRQMHNLHLLDALSVGRHGMPTLEAEEVLPTRLRSFTTCPRCTDQGAGVHFFLDDYRFEAVWRDPMRYVSMLERFGCVLTPDYSVYIDMPEPIQRYNAYRGRAVGKLWQDAGLIVVPTLTWGEPNTYDWCFEGLPKNATVALSTVGLMKDKGGVDLFRAGANEAMKRLEPSIVLAYGKQCDFDARGAYVVWYESDMNKRFNDLKEKRKRER